jgi:hypothetical protein
MSDLMAESEMKRELEVNGTLNINSETESNDDFDTQSIKSKTAKVKKSAEV